MNSSFLVRNRRNRYGWEIPTRRAIASVGVPSRPPLANSKVAASRTSSRRSSAVSLVLGTVAVMRRKLVLTHFAVNPVRPCLELVCERRRASLVHHVPLPGEQAHRLA